MDGCGTVSVAPKPGMTVLASPLAYEGYEQPIVRVIVGDAPRLHDVEVVIRRARAWGAIDLTAVGESGRPLESVELSLENEVGCYVPAFWKTRIDLDDRGRARVEKVLPGRYRATVGKAAAEVEVSVDGVSTLELVIPGR